MIGIIKAYPFEHIILLDQILYQRDAILFASDFQATGHEYV